MKKRFCACLCSLVLLVACHKKEPSSNVPAFVFTTDTKSNCGKEIIAVKPVKAGETGIVLPEGTVICISQDSIAVTVTLPKGFAFVVKGLAQKTLPIGQATYNCVCSGTNACHVFYAEGLGFGCLQSNCSGSCYGRFTYKGYSVDRVIDLSQNKVEFFSNELVQSTILQQYEAYYNASTIPDFDGLFRNKLLLKDYVFVKEKMGEVTYHLLVLRSAVTDKDTELMDPTKASCNCEGTNACQLKTAGIGKFKIYYCDGNCNGCELTI
ncbi:MAG: hypothetical protein SGI96_18835 [Bacteroidota bacterium]|nr:hypothetical protein [Bacteroidota bacterium]